MNSLIFYATTQFYSVSRGMDTWEGDEILQAYDAMAAQNPSDDDCQYIIVTGTLPASIPDSALPYFNN